MGANESHGRVRSVDLDVGDPHGPRWSLASLGLPLPMVAVLLVTYGGGILWIDGKLSKIDTVVEQQKEIKAEIYHQGDAARDLALRDQRIDQLERRMSIMEGYIDGRRR